ncbi:MAG: hypothetical protein K2G44_06255 [Clostridia bacterium]|nr:hypothetical protein [Clostridia bacterium]
MEKLCQNCKHFTQHYYINCLNRICPTNCGVCKLKKGNNKERKKAAFDKACELWETNEKSVDDLGGGIEDKLENILNRLNEIINRDFE